MTERRKLKPLRVSTKPQRPLEPLRVSAKRPLSFAPALQPSSSPRPAPSRFMRALLGSAALVLAVGIGGWVLQSSSDLAPQTGEHVPQPPTPGRGNVAQVPSGKVGVRCGGRVCRGDCCVQAGCCSTSVCECGDSRTTMACDGPEDCAKGWHCGWYAGNKLEGTECTQDATEPMRLLCHDDGDCNVLGTRCEIGQLSFTGRSVRMCRPRVLP